MLNIVIPMAGAGSRFAKEGYTDPKPLIPVAGVPMIKLVINNLRPAQPHRFIFICQAAHLVAYPKLADNLRAWAPGCAIVEVEGLTEGAACTVLSARTLIDSDEPMMVANSDQYVDVDINAYLAGVGSDDGYIMTMPGNDPKWSYVRRENGRVVEVVEKVVVSDEATVGIYNFAKGRQFVEFADAMIAANERVNNEFYVAPVYTRMAAAGANIGTCNIGDRMHGIGIPTDLAQFLVTPVCAAAVAKVAA